ncbi:MAG: RusA family crossover junction endodeoxyribonuclease, partial [Micropruina sp.]|uniref:RusA family crossover junction endodeoxyribonuclease n=1 Tax=Micropruina sp. TaxID=2737536 RepID=UPI0039E22CB5
RPERTPMTPNTHQPNRNSGSPSDPLASTETNKQQPVEGQCPKGSHRPQGTTPLRVPVTKRFAFVEGRPAPQGSHAYRGHRGGKPILTESSKYVAPWRETIKLAAARHGGMLPAGPVAVELDFLLPRPQRCPRPTPPAIKRVGDLDKLVRAVLDAITGVWIADDAHVTRLAATKRTAEPDETPGCAINVHTLERP